MVHNYLDRFSFVPPFNASSNSAVIKRIPRAEFIRCLTESGAKNAVIHFAEDQFRFVVSTDEESLVFFLSIQSSATFSEMRIESRNNNIISIEIGIPNLVHALKAGASSHFVTLKLTKKGASPYLTVDAQVHLSMILLLDEEPSIFYF